MAQSVVKPLDLCYDYNVRTDIVYCSKRGSVKRYALMLARKTGGEIFDLKGYSYKKRKPDLLIFGGWLCANQIVGLKKFRKKTVGFGGKTLYFCCGYTPESADFGAYLARRNGVGDLFYMRGKTDLSLIKGKEGSVIKAVMRELTMQPPQSLSAEDKGILSAVVNTTDFVSEKRLDAIIKRIDEINQNRLSD